MHLIPDKFFVGDEVELYYLLNDFETTSCKSFNIEKIEKTDDVTIKSICLVSKENKNYLLIKFVPWKSGQLILPSLEGLGLKLTLPPINVSSTLELEGLTTSTLQEVRPPILQDGTIYLLYRYIAFFLLATFILSLSFVFFKKRGKSFLNFILQKYAISLFYIKLIFLKNRWKHVEIENELDVKSWLKQYEMQLKNFLFSIYKIKNPILSHALTYSEIEEKIENTYNASKDKMELLHSIFEVIKQLRFSNVKKSKKHIQKNLLTPSFNLIKLYKGKI